jgi:hypothetical protein
MIGIGVILAEVWDSSIEQLHEEPLAKYVRAQGYEIFAKSFNTVIFCQAECEK